MYYYTLYSLWCPPCPGSPTSPDFNGLTPAAGSVWRAARTVTPLLSAAQAAPSHRGAGEAPGPHLTPHPGPGPVRAERPGGDGTGTARDRPSQGRPEAGPRRPRSEGPWPGLPARTCGRLRQAPPRRLRTLRTARRHLRHLRNGKPLRCSARLGGVTEIP